MPVARATRFSSMVQGSLVILARPERTGPATPNPAAAGRRFSEARKSRRISSSDPKSALKYRSNRRIERVFSPTSAIATAVFVPPISPARTLIEREHTSAFWSALTATAAEVTDGGTGGRGDGGETKRGNDRHPPIPHSPRPPVR